MILIILLTQLNNGYLTVRADRDSLPVYVDNDYIGQTPVIKYPLKPDEYSVGFFPQDSIENASWRFKSGSLGALWKVARFGEGIVQVRVAPDSLTEIELSYRRVTQAPGISPEAGFWKTSLASCRMDWEQWSAWKTGPFHHYLSSSKSAVG